MMYGYGNSMFLFNNGIIATPAANPLWNSLYAVYKAESNANDSLGVYNGTAQGGLTYGAGVDGNGFVFNGTNAYVSLPAGALDTFTGDFSINVWFKPTTVTGNYCLFVADNYSAPNERGVRLLQVNQTLRLNIYNNTTNVVLNTGNVFSINTWYNIVVTHSSTGNKIYINGSLSASDSDGTNAIFDTNTVPYIGVNAGVGITPTFFMSSGSIIDELYLWNNRVLSASNVTELYNAGAGTFY